MCLWLSAVTVQRSAEWQKSSSADNATNTAGNLRTVVAIVCDWKITTVACSRFLVQSGGRHLPCTVHSWRIFSEFTSDVSTWPWLWFLIKPKSKSLALIPRVLGLCLDSWRFWMLAFLLFLLALLSSKYFLRAGDSSPTSCEFVGRCLLSFHCAYKFCDHC